MMRDFLEKAPQRSPQKRMHGDQIFPLLLPYNNDLYMFKDNVRLQGHYSIDIKPIISADLLYDGENGQTDFRIHLTDICPSVLKSCEIFWMNFSSENFRKKRHIFTISFPNISAQQQNVLVFAFL